MDTPHKPYFGFALEPALHGRLRTLIDAIRQDADQPGLARDAASVISDLLRSAMRAFYFDVIEAIPTAPSARKSADAGINTVLKGTLLVVQKMVNTLDGHDLRVFADYMETLTIQKDDGHFIAYPLNARQAAQFEVVVSRIRDDADTGTYNHLIVDLLCSLTDEAVKYFYDTPTRMIEIRSFIKKSADLAIRTVSKGIHYVIRQLFRHTRQRELLVFSHFLQQQLVYV